jgi:HlyD family secretion protein
MIEKTILLLLLISLGLYSCSEGERQVQPQMRKLTEAVYASGTLQPEHEYKVVSNTDGFLKTAFVNEGDTVATGQLLFQLHNTTSETQLKAAHEVADKTSALSGNNAPQVKELQQSLATALLRLQTDSAQYGRYKRLYEQAAVSRLAYEKQWLQFEATEKEVTRIRQQIREVQLNASLQMQQAQNAVSLARTGKENENIKSFTSGVVFDVLKQQGDLVYPNQPIALVGSGRMIARLLVDEDDLSKLYITQKVLITADAYPNRVFAARIEKIYPILNKTEQSFRVDAVLDEQIPAGLYGLNLEANIIVSENKTVMVIPKEALLKGDSVMVKQGKEKKLVKITKGIQDNNWVEVKAGLDASSIVILQ